MEIEPKPMGEVEPQAREELTQRRDHMLSFTSDDNKEKVEVGKDWQAIIEGRLAQRSGYRTAADFIKVEMPGHSESTFKNCAAVARSFKEETVLANDFSKLRLLVTLVEALQVPIPDPPDAFPLKVARDGETWIEKPFAQCSAREISRAIRFVRHPGPDVDPNEVPKIDMMNQGVDEACPDDPKANCFGKTEEGETFLSFEHLPLSRLSEVLGILKRWADIVCK